MSSAILYPRHYFTSNEYSATYAVKVEHYDVNDSVFKFENVPYSTYLRFIELLPSTTSLLFMKTSKYNYCNAVNLRGIECAELNFLGETWVRSYFDRLWGLTEIQCFANREKWTLNLFPCRKLVTVCVFPPGLPFSRTYKQLTMIVHNIRKDVVDRYTDCFIHPGLDRVYFSAGCCLPRETVDKCQFNEDNVKNCFDGLMKCDNLKYFTFQRICPSMNKAAAFDKTHVLVTDFCQQHKKLKSFAFNSARSSFEFQLEPVIT